MHPFILDSGAYSAWTQNDEVNIDDYIAYAKANAKYISHVVNLDQIPGRPNRPVSADQVEASAAKSLANFLYIREQGIESMPVYHQGERLYWLDKMMELGSDYIGISPANDKKPEQRQDWLDMVFEHIIDEGGKPIIKTHAFGLTTARLLARYPWYSADSTTWALAGAYGVVYMPTPVRGGGLEWIKEPTLVVFSYKSHNSKKAAKHYSSLPRAAKKWVDEYLTGLGYHPRLVTTSYKVRDELNAYYFLQVEKALNHPDHVPTFVKERTRNRRRKII